MPNRFVIDAPRLAEAARRRLPAITALIPIVIAGSVEGRAEAKTAYDRMLGVVPALYEKTADHYARLDRDTVSIATPDDAARHGVPVGEGGHRQGGRDQSAARHRARGRLPHLRRERAPGLRLVLRARRAVDDARLHCGGRLRHDADGARVPAQVPAGRRQDPARDLAERGAHAVVHELRVPVGERGRDAALRDRARRLLARDRRPRLPRGRVAVRSSRPTASRPPPTPTATASSRTRTSATAGSKGGALYPAARRDLHAGAVDRGVARPGRARRRDERRRSRRGARARPSARGRDRGDVLAATAASTRSRRLPPDAARPSRARTARAPGPLDALARARSSTRTPCCRRCRCGSAPSMPSARSRRSIISAPARSPTDWGARILSNRSALYDPLSYHYGSVWPLFTGWAAMGGVPLRPAARRVPGADGERAAHVAGRARLRHRAALRRLRTRVRPLVASPGLVGGDGGDARSSRALRDRGGRGGRHAALRARASRDWDRVDGAERARWAPRATTCRCGAAATRRPCGLPRAASDAAGHPQRVVVSPAFPSTRAIRGVTVNGASRAPEVTPIGDVQRVQIAVSMELTSGSDRDRLQRRRGHGRRGRARAADAGSAERRAAHPARARG